MISGLKSPKIRCKLGCKRMCEALREQQKNILNLNLYVSKKITEEGWKIGYMERNEPVNEHDSGRAFFAGNENDEYNIFGYF